MSATLTDLIQLSRAEAAGDHRLRLSFDDGHVVVVDFAPFLSASRHPDIRRYLEPVEFAKFTVEDGQLHWNDFDLVFPVADLYAARIL